MHYKALIFIHLIIIHMITLTGCLEPSPSYALSKPDRHKPPEQSVSTKDAPGISQPDAHETESKAPKTTKETSKPETQPEDVALKEEPRSKNLQGHININTASPQELQLLPRIGKSISQRIVDYRQKRPFKRVTQLKRVKGIGPTTYKNIAIHLCVDCKTTLRQAK